VLKYMDRDNDLVTITSRHDVQAALAEALRGMDRRLGVVPPIRVTATPVSSKVGGLCVCVCGCMEE
jgi:PB1 domain